MNRRSVTLMGGIAALAMFAAGCGDDPIATTPSASSTPSSPASTTQPAGHVNPGAQQPGGGAPAPAHTTTHANPPARTVTVTPKTTTQPGNPVQPDCSGPNPGTICTNPNYGAGTDPNENGGDASVPTTTERDDDPGGKPCTTGMGVSGVYIYDGETWVCQIS